jgi:phosphate-selective porin OprO and OprP
MRNKLALTSGAALGAVLAITLSAGTAQAQDTTTTWKGAPQFQNDTLTFKVRGRVYMDVLSIERDPVTGPTTDTQTSRMRTARLGVEGTFNANWAYKVEASIASSGGTTQWEDVMLEYKPNDFTSFMIGNFKTVSFENISSSRYNEVVERGPFNDVLGIGRVASFQAKMNGENWTAAGFVHGDSINSADQALGVSEQFAYGARGTFAPINGDFTKVHLGAWVRQRDRGQGNSAITYQIRPNTNFGSNGTDINSGAIGDKDTQIGLEGLLIHKAFSVQGEYANIGVDRTTGQDEDINAYYVSASWFPTGEMRNLDVKKGELGRTKILNPMTAGGMGALELVARYDNVDMTDLTVSDVRAGEYKAWTVGATWYPHPYTRFMLNYTKGENHQRVGGNDSDVSVVTFRTQFDW